MKELENFIKKNKGLVILISFFLLASIVTPLLPNSDWRWWLIIIVTIVTKWIAFGFIIKKIFSQLKEK